MNTIQLKNGTIVAIGSNKDIVDIVETYCGHELSQLLLPKLVEVDKDILYAREKAHTDCDAYLSSLESKETALRDILEIAESLINYIEDSKRINKDTINKKVIEFINMIENEL